MPLLKVEPSGVVTSLEEFFAIAHALGRDAATRYEQLALQMRSSGDTSLAEVFLRLAAEERTHLNDVARWSERSRGEAPDVANLHWVRPETFDDEGASTTAPEIQTGYGILAMAVRNEERAFAFWSYVAAHASLPEIEQAAERMAHEKLNHVAMLRQERRRAYHAERAQTQPAAFETVANMATHENRLANLLDPFLSRLDQSVAERLAQIIRESRRSADELAGEALLLAPLTASTRALEDPVVFAELLVERYLEAADRFQDEAALTLSQTLASRAINRLAWLRAHLRETEQG